MELSGKILVVFPVIETLDVSILTDLNTVSGGNIISNSGSAITIRGICWDVNPNPDVSLSSKTESFSVAGF